MEVPKVARSPLELLQNDGTRQAPLLSQIYAPVTCGTLGFIAVIVGNWVTKRPLMSGIQKHIVVATVGAGIGLVLDDYRNKYFADRDAAYRHYIQLHPEEFPDYEPKKIRDVFEPWVPIR